MDEPIIQFKSHIDGKNADVTVYENRIEWERRGRLGGSKGTETLPARAITSVSTKKDGLRFVIVNVTAAGAAVGFRVDRSAAPHIKDTLTGLMLA